MTVGLIGRELVLVHLLRCECSTILSDLSGLTEVAVRVKLLVLLDLLAKLAGAGPSAECHSGWHQASGAYALVCWPKVELALQVVVDIATVVECSWAPTILALDFQIAVVQLPTDSDLGSRFATM